MSRRTARILVLASVLACAIAPTRARGAGTVLSSGSSATPASVGFRMALAVNPAGTTRWTELTVPPGSRRAWLVPVRPAAAIDWAPAAWLDALDDATAPRIVRPNLSTSCSVKWGPETPAPWTSVRAKEAGASFVVQKTTAEAKSWASANGYSLNASDETRVDAAFATGWQLAAVELPASTFGLSSATLRVTDDGGAVLPLVLSGGASTTSFTVFVIGAGEAGVSRTIDVDPREITWGPLRSTYAGWRKDRLIGANGALWLRESSSHAALFAEVSVPDGSPIRSVVTSYFADAACVSAAKNVAASTNAVGPTSLSCGAKTDLALALAGAPPGNAVLTRLVGVLPNGRLGTNLSVELNGAVARSAVIPAGRYSHCEEAKPDDPWGRPDDRWGDPDARWGAPNPPGTGTPIYTGGGTVYVPGDGCSGGTVTTTESTDEGEGESSSDDSGDTSDSSDSSDGWDDSSSDDSGDTSDSSDGWDDSDLSDGCSSDSDDGWDSSDSDSCSSESSSSLDDRDDQSLRKKPRHRSASKKKSSPVSRFALLAVALLLPLRRRARVLLGEES